MTAPRIPYWTSRDPVAPAIAPTTTKSRAAQTALPPTTRTTARPNPGVGGLQCPRPIDLVAGRPPLHKADPADAGKNHHVHQHQHGDNGDGGRLDVVIGLLESDNDKRRKEVDRQHHEKRDREDRPRVPRSVPIPRPLPDAIHAATLNAPDPAICRNGAASLRRHQFEELVPGSRPKTCTSADFPFRAWAPRSVSPSGRVTRASTLQRRQPRQHPTPQTVLWTCPSDSTQATPRTDANSPRHSACQGLLRLLGRVR